MKEKNKTILDLGVWEGEGFLGSTDLTPSMREEIQSYSTASSNSLNNSYDSSHQESLNCIDITLDELMFI